MAKKLALALHAEAPQRAQGIEDCAWMSDGERCHYPGTIWRNVHGVGSGFCRFHIQEDITAAYGARIVVESRNYKPRTMAQRDHDAVFGPRG